MMDYLVNQYVPTVAMAEFLAVQASYNWLFRNWEILGEIGLRYSGPNGSGFVNAILISLHNEIFRDPTPETWAKVPSLAGGVQFSVNLIEARRAGCREFGFPESLAATNHPPKSHEARTLAGSLKGLDGETRD